MSNFLWSMNVFEAQSFGPKTAMRLCETTREHLLRDNGHSDEDFLRARREIEFIKASRIHSEMDIFREEAERLSQQIVELGAHILREQQAAVAASLLQPVNQGFALSGPAHYWTPMAPQQTYQGFQRPDYDAGDGCEPPGSFKAYSPENYLQGDYDSDDEDLPIGCVEGDPRKFEC